MLNLKSKSLMDSNAQFNHKQKLLSCRQEQEFWLELLLEQRELDDYSKNRRFVWSFFFLYFSHRSYGFRFMGNSNTFNGNESTIIYYSNDKRSKSLWFFYIMNGGDLRWVVPSVLLYQIDRYTIWKPQYCEIFLISVRKFLYGLKIGFEIFFSSKKENYFIHFQ